MNPTQQMIADRIGISQRLVSYALSGSTRVSSETRRRVLEAAEEMNYQPNKAARALSTGRSQLIALRLPNIESWYGLRVLSALRRQAEESSYDLVIVNSNASHLSQWPLDGCITLDPLPQDPLAETQSRRTQRPLIDVAMGCYPHLAAAGQDYVGLDLYTSVREALTHLTASGCRRIAFLAENVLFRPGEPRQETYGRYMQEIEGVPEIIRVEGTGLTRQDSARALAEYLAGHKAPDGILCGNDDVSIGAYRALRSLGLKVPGDVKLIGCDGIMDAADHEPPLSTIEFPYEEMCRLAWEMLMKRIENPRLSPQRVTLPAALAIRESSSDI